MSGTLNLAIWCFPSEGRFGLTPDVLHVQPLEDPDLPELEPYRTLRRRKDMDRLSLLVAEGDKCVR